MYDARKITKYSQENVDPKVSAATSLEEHTKRWKEDGQDDLENVAAGERHLGLMYFTTRSCDGEWVTTLNTEFIV